ncbi:calcineurin-like phosphoesterase [Thraustotheca clavata]|uniref:cysteine dioxygenase n=1 Tax=Thraustotheca clavata TaxID=74557 RepID=A0A1V9ZS17_9STRA|nr:calcineurin-like phosphoesterase [Thraustotheca clavata]
MNHQVEEITKTKQLNLRELVAAIELELQYNNNESLDLSQKSKLQQFLAGYNCDMDELCRYVHFDPSRNYTRNLIATDNTTYALILLCWNRGRYSPIHDHPSDGCWVRHIQGTVHEVRYWNDGVSLAESASVMITEGVTYMDDTLGLHKVGNPSTEIDAITMHLYAPPYEKCRLFFDPKDANKNSVAFATYYSEYVTCPFSYHLCRNLGDVIHYSIGLVSTMLLRMLTLGAMAASVTAKTILHFSDIHLNITLSSLNYAHDSSQRLLDAALQYAQSVIPTPDLFLHTGDAVAHVKHNRSMLAKAVMQNIRTIEKYYNVRNVTAILGNADFVKDYLMQVTDPKNGTNPSIAMIDQTWRRSLTDAQFEDFDTRGYLWYQLEPNLIMITLNTVPYSIKHAPKTTFIQDPFGQFTWLEKILSEAKSNNTYVYIAGHIPPIIDSYAGNNQWEVQYIVKYQSIVQKFPDTIKAQLFGHVHNIEYRVPIPTLDGSTGVPMFATGAISPYFGNNPSFTVWEYDPTSYDLLDYTVYATNFSDNEELNWKKLFTATKEYNITDLSSPTLRALTQRMKDDPRLLFEYYRHTKADTRRLPPCTNDDKACLDRILCTQTWFTTPEQYFQCVDERIQVRGGNPRLVHAVPRISWFYALVISAIVSLAAAQLLPILMEVRIQEEVEACGDGFEVKLLLLAVLLHRHGFITSIGKALLKGINWIDGGDIAMIVELLFQKDVRGPKLIHDVLHAPADEPSPPKWLKRTQKLIDIETFKLFDSLYLDCTLEKGKEISRKERQEHELLHEKSLVYGEVDYLAFLDVLSKVPIKPGMIFYDLGSGTGRAVFLARLNFDFAKCIGIEILLGLHEAAAQICRNYKEFVQPTISTTSNVLSVAFFHSSFLDLNWSHADVCFANSTCFDSTLLAQISSHAERLRSGAYFITFTKPLTSTEFEIIFKQRYNMSWGPATVYLHQRI